MPVTVLTMSESSSTAGPGRTHWGCSHCDDEALENFRLSCAHIICKGCVIKVIGRTNLRTQKPVASLSVIDVDCPCRGIRKCRGSIQVSRVWYEKHTTQVEVISLLDSDEEDKIKSPAPHNKTAAVTAAAVIKADVQGEQKMIVSPEKEMSISPASIYHGKDINGEGMERRGLKPYYEKGDDVYAKWEETNLWYRGTILSYKTLDSKSRYGDTRNYLIQFNDGDVGETQDFNVFSAIDYDLIMDTNHTEPEEEWKWKGVQKETDPHSSDVWAKVVGWYVVTTIDGKKQKFSTLVGALRAYDESVIDKYGAQTCEDDLNLPEEQRNGRFSFEPPDTSSSVDSLTSSFDNDDESRFSIGDENEQQRSAKRIKIERDAKIIHLPPKLEDDQDEEGAGIEFTENAFIKNRIFHVNPFVNADTKANMGFRDFIELGFVTPCSVQIPETVAPLIDEMTQKQLREAILQQKEWHDKDGREFRASQVAMWLKRAEVGSFVVMRHEYDNCRYCPNWLKRRDESGTVKYIGPVFVIGVVTRKIRPYSDEEGLVISQMEGKLKGIQRFHPLSNVCLVDWKSMGFKEDLKLETQKYINRICQPTVVNICTDYEKVYTDGATSESIRRDLFRNSLPLELFLQRNN